MIGAAHDRNTQRPKRACDPSLPAVHYRHEKAIKEVCNMNTYFPTLFTDNLLSAFDDFDRSFFRSFDDADRMLYGKHAAHMMKTDVMENDNGYEVAVDLPGFKKDEIRLDLENGYLTITTEKSLEENNEGNRRMLRRERYTGTLQRSFYVGDALTEEDIKASYQDGVLKLVIPKKDAQTLPAKKTICIA